MTTRPRSLHLADGTPRRELVAWLDKLGPLTDTLAACAVELPTSQAIRLLEQLEADGLVASKMIGDPEAIQPLREWTATGKPDPDGPDTKGNTPTGS